MPKSVKACAWSLAGNSVECLKSRKRAGHVWNELQEQGGEKRVEGKQVKENYLLMVRKWNFSLRATVCPWSGLREGASSNLQFTGILWRLASGEGNSGSIGIS